MSNEFEKLIGSLDFDCVKSLCTVQLIAKTGKEFCRLEYLSKSGYENIKCLLKWLGVFGQLKITEN